MVDIIERVGDNLFYDNGEKFNIIELFKEDKNTLVSFDLTFTSSAILKELTKTYEFVDDIKQIKTNYQWSVIESETTCYMIRTKHSSWINLTSMMGLDQTQEVTLASFNVKTVRELYEKSVKMGLTKLTIAGTAVNVFETFVNTGVLYVNSKPLHLLGKSNMDEWRGYSSCDIPALDMLGRPTYRGAITYGVPGVYGDMIHIDKRSMYPSMASYYRMPYGLPHNKKESETDLCLVSPSGVLRLKEGCFPTIGFSNPKMFRNHALSGRMGSLIEFLVLNDDIFFFDFEWELILKMYEFDGVVENRIYVSTKEPTHLKDYFENYYKAKQTLTKNSDEYVSAKKLLNALYGKFAIKTLRESISYSDGKRHKVKKQVEKLSYYNILLASHITARARCCLMDLAITIGLEYVKYMDTDSIFFMKEAFKDRETMLKVCEIGKKMGDWDLEHEGVELNVIGSKTYQIKDKDGRVSTKCAGLALENSLDIEWLGLYEGLQVDVIKRKRGRDMVLREEPTKFTISSKPKLISPR